MSQDHVFTLESRPQNRMEALKRHSRAKIRAACMDAHRCCLALVSRSISEELNGFELSAERMSLLLAAAQLCHSYSVLSQTESTQTLRLTTAVVETCLACAEAFSDRNEDLAALACIQSCQEAARLCAEVLESVRGSV